VQKKGRRIKRASIGDSAMATARAAEQGAISKQGGVHRGDFFKHPHTALDALPQVGPVIMLQLV